ncbi:cyclic-phosphate processing receiver domain-containing protein [Paenibacillus herberti]|uniref:Cell division protein FtsJ n=1 Tax=Paenibacillus herberti TaxID=1619309 RepID=A0A229P2V3_9BACL|nr:cyclic-phosphate processing receiver domain-containing protein [Paenibacillus herberti]OXM16448.1 cell division protein FtsJ [Paenibacillus herberti]
MIHLYLDDFRHCPEGFMLARTAEECIVLLQSGEIGMLSLDYDLGWNEPTGYEVASWIADSGRFPREIYLHTSSEAGRQQMYKRLSDALPTGVTLHGGPLTDEALKKALETGGDSSTASIANSEAAAGEG